MPTIFTIKFNGTPTAPKYPLPSGRGSVDMQGCKIDVVCGGGVTVKTRMSEICGGLRVFLPPIQDSNSLTMELRYFPSITYDAMDMPSWVVPSLSDGWFRGDSKEYISAPVCLLYLSQTQSLGAMKAYHLPVPRMYSDPLSLVKIPMHPPIGTLVITGGLNGCGVRIAAVTSKHLVWWHDRNCQQYEHDIKKGGILASVCKRGNFIDSEFLLHSDDYLKDYHLLNGFPKPLAPLSKNVETRAMFPAVPSTTAAFVYSGKSRIDNVEWALWDVYKWSYYRVGLHGEASTVAINFDEDSSCCVPLVNCKPANGFLKRIGISMNLE